MSKIGSDFGNVHIMVEADGREAFDIHRALTRAFNDDGIRLVDKVTIINNWERHVKKGPAKGLNVENFDFGISS